MLVCLFLFLSVAAAQVLDLPDVPWTGFEWRQWPAQILDIRGWGYYAAYLAIVFNAPTIGAIALIALMCVGCCICRMCSAPYSDAKRSICVIIYTVLFIIFILMIIGAASFLLFAFSSYEVVKTDGNALLKKVFRIPTDLRASLTEIANIIPDIEENVLDLLGETSLLRIPFERVVDMVNDAQWALDNGPSLVDQMYSNFSVIQDRAADLDAINFCTPVACSILWGSYTFPPSTSIFQPVAGFAFTSLETIAQTGSDAVKLAQDTINSTVQTFTDVINLTVWDVKGVLDGVLESMEVGMNNAGVNNASVDRYSAISYVVEILIIVVVVGFYCTFVLSYALCYCCLNRCGGCLAISSVTSCCGVWWLMWLGGVFVCFFFVADDICRQGERTFQRSSQWLPAWISSLLNVSVPLIGSNEKFTIDLIHSAMNVLYCGKPESNGVETYIEAYGLTLTQLNASESLQQYTKLFTDGLGTFDVIGTVADMLDVLSNFSSDVSDWIPFDYDGDVTTLQGALDQYYGVDDLNNFLATLGFDQADETAKYNELNTLLDAQCSGIPYSIYRDDIGNGFEIGDLRGECNGGAGHTQEVYINETIVPALETYYDAYYSDDAYYARFNRSELHQAMAALQAAEIASRVPIDNLLTTPNLGTRIMQDVEAGFATLMKNISDIVPNVMSDIDYRLGNSPIFGCSEVGQFYSSLKTDGCGVGVTALGFVGFMTIGMSLLNFLFFWVILYTSSMLMDRAKNTEYVDYSDGGRYHDYRWSESGSFTDVSDASSGWSSEEYW